MDWKVFNDFVSLLRSLSLSSAFIPTLRGSEIFRDENVITAFTHETHAKKHQQDVS